MVAFRGPNSTTCAPVGAIKRPSDVPPAVESSESKPHVSFIAFCVALTSSPGLVKKACPDKAQSISYSILCSFNNASTRLRISVSVIAVEKRKLNMTSHSPGITFVTPVPE